MPRTLLLALLGSSLVVAAGLTAGAQEKKKEKPKGPPRIALNDPAKLADDKDFAVQGEYVGKGGASKVDATTVAAHVIALGEGKFEVKWYYGGLPGDGWNGKPAEIFKGERQGDRAILSMTTPDG